jgi:transcriptional regulator with XRE-family HTH domain
METDDDDKNKHLNRMNDDFYIDRVAHFFKSKRKYLKLTQEQMAERFEIDTNQIWRMEQGKSTTKLSTSLKIINEFAAKAEMTPGQFVSYLLKQSYKEEKSNLGPNEIALLKSFRAASAELRRDYAQLAQSSDIKFSLALEVLKFPTPIIKKILELLRFILEK